MDYMDKKITLWFIGVFILAGALSFWIHKSPEVFGLAILLQGTAFCTMPLLFLNEMGLLS